MYNELLKKLMSDNKWPVLLESVFDEEAKSLSISLHVTENTHWFSGHFPEQAVLPGVVQVHWAVEIAKKIAGGFGSFKSIGNLKFKTMVMPNTKMDLALIINEEKYTVMFSYKNDTDVFSTGTLLFNA